MLRGRLQKKSPGLLSGRGLPKGTCSVGTPAGIFIRMRPDACQTKSYIKYIARVQYERNLG